MTVSCRGESCLVTRLEEPQAYWSQPKMRRRALFVFLLVLGMFAGVGVGVQGGEPDIPVTLGIVNGFDCSNTTVGCLYTGTQLLDFQEPDSFLVANCTDTNFDNENCGRKVNVPTPPFGIPEQCQFCSFVGSADGEWRLAYDCSNLLRGDCAGRDTSNRCILSGLFVTTLELRSAENDYLADNSVNSTATAT
jgi:hypothetical protein